MRAHPFTRRHIFIDEDGEQRGPYSKDQLERFMKAGRFDPATPAWSENQEKWAPLSEVLFAAPQASPPEPAQRAFAGAAVVIAGWICLVVGLAFLRVFWLSVILFAASFALSVVALCGKHVKHGIALNIATFVAFEFAMQILFSWR